MLLRRLDVLERLVFGRSYSAASAAAAPVREVEPIAGKIEGISKTLARAEGGGRDLQDLAVKGVQTTAFDELSRSPEGRTVVELAAMVR